jgi:hypothetical protein
VTLEVDPAFSCSDSDTMHPCSRCAEAFIEHAEMFDVDVNVVDRP